MRTLLSSTAFIGLALSLGCTFIARGPEEYRADTRDLLETRNPAVKACYDRALEQNPNVSGKVTVNFTVEKQTGMIQNVSVDEGRTTAPDTLSQCVVGAVEGLTLMPEDQRDGLATFTYVFRAEQAAPAGKPAA